MPEQASIFGQLGLAVLLGLLVGLQREHAAHPMAGMRTFPLITVSGTVAALLGKQFGGWIVGAGWLGIVVVLGIGTLLRLRTEKAEELGTTTYVAGLLMYGVGALLVVAPLAVGVAVGGGVAVLLQFKPELHRIAQQLGDEDLRAIMQFVLLSCVVLPILPNQTYGPFEVFNPYKSWLLVVLIVGMSVSGYIIYKFLGPAESIWLGGILGGVVSSTATTLSTALMVRQEPALQNGGLMIVALASSVAFLRVGVIVGVVAPETIAICIGPLMVVAGLGLLPVLIAWWSRRPSLAAMPPQKNPAQLGSALLFGGWYVGILFALAAARHYWADQGLYLVAGLSGLADLDAITLSTARLMAEHNIETSLGWRLILTAGLANLGFKIILAGLWAGTAFCQNLLRWMALPVLGGLLVLVFWP
ncbi:MAG: MgtC/SapB family protein [Thermoguttaceae bacterium]|nr:MgtC/SapB family protein [Thermoguttaceae bacterium]MDW8038828.1 MgtC/SapB family protein [Thermoguttaceae bacterium]